VTKAFKVGLVYAAGTATVAPIKFTSTSATLLTTPTAGSMEVDSSGNLYYSPSTTRYTVPLSTTGNSLIFTTSGATTITLPTSGTMITSSSPTITTPTIATINAGGIAATPFLYSDVTTGTVNVATGLTSGVLKLGNSISISGATGQTVATPTVGSGSSNGITIQSGNSPSMPGTVSINAGGDGTTVFGGTITLSGGTGYIGGATTIQAGSYAGSGTGGLLNLQAGGGSTNGAITIGTTYASSITIGKSGVSTTISGTTYYSFSGTNFLQIINPASNASVIKSPDTATTSVQSYDVYLSSGNATGTTSNSGSVYIDSGTATSTAGSIIIGSANNAPTISIGTQTIANTLNIATGAGTTNKTINIGTASTAGTTAITIGSSSGATSTIQLNGTVNTTSGSFKVGNTTLAQGVTGTITFPSTAGTLMLNPMTTAGDIIYGGASGAPTRLAGSATNNYVLTYNTGTTAPVWAAVTAIPYTPSTLISNSTTTAVAFNSYFIDTTAARTLTLPAAATLGDEIHIFDVSGSAATNNITVANNGLNIRGSAQTLVINVNYAAVVLVYLGATYGWRVS